MKARDIYHSQLTTTTTNIMTTTPATPTLTYDALTQEQLKGLHTALLNSSDYGFDALFEGLLDECKEQAERLLREQLAGAVDADGNEIEPDEDAITALQNSLFARVTVKISLDGFNTAN